MSLGHGNIQKSILQSIKNSDTPIQRNKLFWMLARSNDKVIVTETLCEDIDEGYIENSFSKSFQRALKRLVDEKMVSVQKRRLMNIQEFIEYYPFKTSKLEIFLLRKILLPFVKTYLEGPYSRVPYTVADNELFILDKIKNEFPKRIKRYTLNWRKKEKRIISLLARYDLDSRSQWISLMIKGRQLFLDNRVKYGKAFHVIIKKIGEADEFNNEVEYELYEEINKFKKKVFKPEIMKHSKLKSQLHLIAYFSERTKSGLKDEIKQHFLDEQPEIIENLPDYHQPEGRGFTRFPPTFSPILDKLIDRHVFSNFEFLSV